MDVSYFERKIEPIVDILSHFSASNKRIFTTSSFQGQSMPLLHILATHLDRPKVILTDTGFLFPQTIVFAEKISRTLGLQLERVYPQTSKIAQRDIRGHFLYASDPDLCCELNKVEPLNAIIANYDVWVNGVRRDQSKARSELQSFEKTINGCTRYHPMLDWTAKEIYYYRQCYELDEHPLESAGFQSIGCQPCTSIRNPCSSERQSRWFGMNKTECGLNTTLIAKS